jgi:hypothetical protein
VTQPTTVINIHRTKPPSEGYVYIGRPSKWGNPFPVGNVYSRDEALEMYERHVRDSPELLAALPELAGKTLGCFCAPSDCHGFVLLKLLRERRLI